MEYVFTAVFVGLLIGLAVYQRKKQQRLLLELKDSKFLQGLIDNEYVEVDKNSYLGNYKGYCTGFYYHEDSKSGLIGHVTINCEMPFFENKGTLREIKAFSKKYHSSGFVIDSRIGFSKELKIDFLLNLSDTDIFILFDEMVSVAKKENFTPLIDQKVSNVS